MPWSSGLGIVVALSLQSQAINMSMCCSRSGGSIDLWMKYGTTRNTAVGVWARVPLRSHMMYAPLRLHEIMIIGPKYRGHIFWLRAFSMAVFVLQMSTRSPLLKLKLWITFPCLHSNRMAARFWVACTWSLSADRSSCCFWSAMAQQATRSVVERSESGGGHK